MKKQAIAQLWKEEVEFLTQAVQAVPRNGIIVEIGTAQGGGFEIISKAREFPDSVEVHTFDPFPGDAVKLIQQENPNTFFYALDSLKGAAQWKRKKAGVVDLLIIDGNHSLKSVHEDLSAWKPFLGNSSRILFHDYDTEARAGVSHPGVKVYCDAILTDYSKKSYSRLGRYLLLNYQKGNKININKLKQTAIDWFSEIYSKSEMLLREIKSKNWDYALLSNMHSRSLKSMDNRRSSNSTDDMVITIACAKLYCSLHQYFLERTKDRSKKLKQLESLDMFIEAVGWKNAFDHKENFLGIIQKCRSINALSRFCASVMVMGNFCDNLLLD